MYSPAGQDVTAVAKPVLTVTLHVLVTYWLLLGAVQLATGHGVLVPALAPDAV